MTCETNRNVGNKTQWSVRELKCVVREGIMRPMVCAEPSSLKKLSDCGCLARKERFEIESLLAEWKLEVCKDDDGTLGLWNCNQLDEFFQSKHFNCFGFETDSILKFSFYKCLMTSQDIKDAIESLKRQKRDKKIKVVEVAGDGMFTGRSRVVTLQTDCGKDFLGANETVQLWNTTINKMIVLSMYENEFEEKWLYMLDGSIPVYQGINIPLAGEYRFKLLEQTKLALTDDARHRFLGEGGRSLVSNNSKNIMIVVTIDNSIKNSNNNSNNSNNNDNDNSLTTNTSTNTSTNANKNKISNSTIHVSDDNSFNINASTNYGAITNVGNQMQNNHNTGSISIFGGGTVNGTETSKDTQKSKEKSK